MLRIARTNKTPDNRTAGKQIEEIHEQHQALIKTIKRHLSPATASLFARPVTNDSSDCIEWYSDLRGQPLPLRALPEKEQLQARKLLNDRLAAIDKLAERLPNLEPGSEGLQTLLHKAARLPDDDSIYVVDGQPVITLWGTTDLTEPTSATSMSNIPRNGTPPVIPSIRGKSRFVKYILWLLLALLIGLLWFWFSKHPLDWQAYNPFRDDYQLLLNEIDAAGNDCQLLEKIYNENPLVHDPEPKFVQLKEKLEAKLQWCAGLADLQNQIASAQGDCTRLEEILTTNPNLADPQGPFIGLEQRLESDIRLCSEYRQLKSQIDSAKDDCQALMQLLEATPRLREAEGMFVPLRKELDQLIAECNSFQALADSIHNAQADCDRLNQIASENASLQNADEKHSALSQQLEDYRSSCKRKQIENSVNLCPGERPKQLAPELVVVFDASGSMAYPSDTRKTKEVERQIAQAGFSLGLSSFLMGRRVTEQQFQNLVHRLSPEKESRIRGAKTAVRKLVQKTPSDMDIGLVVLKDCPGAKKYGFYQPSKRQQLLGITEGLQPDNGTPLGDAIYKAGQMIDGVNKAATMVVISDGEESCNANPCSVARKLAAQKPYLTINVVDILGTGAGNCIAKATKDGKVFTARNMQDIINMTEKAADTAIPKNCKK